MKIDRNRPLPAHTKYKYEECFAKIILEHLFPQRYIDLKIEDRPDLQDLEHQIGVEVTSAVPPADREASSLWTSTVYMDDGLLQRYDLNDLLAIDQESHSKFNRDNLSVETEIQSILKVMKCKKNTLYFSADFLFVDNNYAISDILHTVEGWLNDCFSQLFMFREQFVPDKDTYFAIIIEGYLA